MIVGPSVKNVPRNAIGVEILKQELEVKKNGWAAVHLALIYEYGGYETATDRNLQKYYQVKAQELGFYFPKVLNFMIRDWFRHYPLNDFEKNLERLYVIQKPWKDCSELEQLFLLKNNRWNYLKIENLQVDNDNAIVSYNLAFECTKGIDSRFRFDIARERYNTVYRHAYNAMKQGLIPNLDTTVAHEFKNAFSFSQRNECLFWQLCVKFGKSIEQADTNDPKSMYFFGSVKKSKELRYLRLFNRVNNRVSLAITHWLLCGKRLGVSPDVRKMIGRMIWEQRWEVTCWLKPEYGI
jgi:hypothetical protein